MELAARAASIRADSDALADAATGNLAVPVPSCPGWSMEDLVAHIHQVHRSWYRIIDERIMTPDFVAAPQPEGDALVADFRAQAHRFADLLARTDPDTPCWTWGPTQTAGFHQRFQVQEAALHRWDAQHAIAAEQPLGTEGAADALVFFAELVPMVAPKAEHAFAVEIADDPGGPRVVTMLAAPGRPMAGTLRGAASDLLLVAWKRLPLDAVEVNGDEVAVRGALDAIAFD